MKNDVLEKEQQFQLELDNKLNSIFAGAYDLNKALTIALEKPNIEEAIQFIITWEYDRSLKKAIKNTLTNQPYETCFRHAINRVRIAWYQKELNNGVS